MVSVSGGEISLSVRTFPSDHVPFRFQRILVILVTFATTVSAFMDNVIETKNSEYERCELTLLYEIMNVTSVDIRRTNGACIDSQSVCKKSVGSADFKCIHLSSSCDLATFHLLKFPFFCSSTWGIKKERNRTDNGKNGPKFRSKENQDYKVIRDDLSVWFRAVRSNNNHCLDFDLCLFVDRSPLYNLQIPRNIAGSTSNIDLRDRLSLAQT